MNTTQLLHATQKQNLKTMILAVIYIISPIDFVPEIFFGPFGVADDLIAIIILLRKLFQMLNTPSKEPMTMPSPQNASHRLQTQSTVFCVHCGTQNPDIAVFCHSCGERLVGGNFALQASPK